MSAYVIGFYGHSNSGKTTVIVRLIQRLTKEGYKVATIKHTHKKIGFDSQGTDTWKHGNAGASVTVFSSPIETDILVKKNFSVQETIHHLSTIDSYDCIIIEGVNDPTLQKIRVGTVKKRKNTLWDYQGDFKSLVDYIKNNIKAYKKQEDIRAVSICINGSQIPLTEFPSTVIKNTILGLLQSLKGVRNIHTVDLHIRQ